MRRFFVEEIRPEQGSLIIRGSEAKHITAVLRMERGDRLILMDRGGARFEAVIESVGRREVVVSLEKALAKPDSSPVEIILCQALIRSHLMDFVVQKTSELGVNLIQPVVSVRTVVRPGKERADNMLRHWREIALNSAKQSDRREPAQIAPLCDFRGMVDQLEGHDALKIILWENEGARDVKNLFGSSHVTRCVVGVVGPEGGFAEEEIELARHSGFTPASLGERVLRSETAAIALAAIFQYEWGDLSLKKRGVME
ncbi:MAG: 16S rRNA (uracil(1498)-N(3))-methyltransferase [Desulfobacterales bacterium]|nr:16S rRNA (uracil(1498)-N(3))-methyltransferase [Desulfobacterales bacterium]